MAIIKKKIEAEVVEDATKPAVKATAKKKPAAKKVAKSTGNAYRVLLRPLATEKSAGLATDGVYLFEVARGSDKVEVRDAIKALYGVTPRRVNIMNRKGKAVRFGRTLGRRKDWRAAYVFLKKGEHIDLHEGV
ncbi:50S ribosomal protein L23 [Candidatus Uhrbacteria bacterium]|nr:50S ribosomal protein L23 [Candidatus Uhrbacteria bacterium]